jgi:hypothetical protein
MPKKPTDTQKPHKHVGAFYASETPGCFVQDNDLRWYVVGADRVEDFNEWVRDMERSGVSKHDFRGCRISSPRKVLLYKWAVS